MKQKNKNNLNKGITLISLIITIVIMVILATVTLNLVVNKNGLYHKSIQTASVYDREKLKEEVKEALYTKQVGNYSNDGENNLETYLRAITDANVENKLPGMFYVTRKKNTVTVYDDGTIIDGKVIIPNDLNPEKPEVKDDSWYIYNCEQLVYLRDFVNGIIQDDTVTLGENTNVYLMNDLDLGARQSNGELISGTNWTPIGISSTNYFRGIFYGNNHSITGIYVNNTNNYSGIFGMTLGSIDSLNSVDNYIKGAKYTGGIVGAIRPKGMITNCTNSSTVIGSTEWHTGGICGMIYFDENKYNTIDNCSNSGNVTSGGLGVGGIVGTSAVSSVSNCSNTGNITGTLVSTDHKDKYGARVGGIVGTASGQIINCKNMGRINSSGNYAGGICGITFNEIISSCNMGVVESNASFIGGIIGDQAIDSSEGDVPFSNVKYCYNKGSVSGLSINSDYVGGITGCCSAILENSYNLGDIKTLGTAYGGIVGLSECFTDDHYSKIQNCYNVGNILASGKYAGTLVGELSGTLEHSYYLKPKDTSSIVNSGSCEIWGQNYFYCKLDCFEETDEFMKLNDFLTLLNTSVDGTTTNNWKFDSESEYKYPVLNK